MKDLVKGNKVRRKTNSVLYPEILKDGIYTFESYDIDYPNRFILIKECTQPLSIENFEKVETGLEDLAKLVFKKGNKVRAIKDGGYDEWKRVKGDILEVSEEVNEHEFKSGRWFYPSEDFELIKDTKISPCVHQSPEEKEEVAQEIVNESPIARVFDSGMKRDNDENKPYVHNLQGYTRLRFGYLTRMGARNYGDGNFLLGSPSEDALKSLDRHLAKFLDGDRSEDHLAAMIFNVQLVMLNEKREGMSADHYFKPENK